VTLSFHNFIIILPLLPEMLPLFPFTLAQCYTGLEECIDPFSASISNLRDDAKENLCMHQILLVFRSLASELARTAQLLSTLFWCIGQKFREHTVAV